MLFPKRTRKPRAGATSAARTSRTVVRNAFKIFKLQTSEHLEITFPARVAMSAAAPAKQRTLYDFFSFGKAKGPLQPTELNKTEVAPPRPTAPDTQSPDATDGKSRPPAQPAEAAATTGVTTSTATTSAAAEAPASSSEEDGAEDAAEASGGAEAPASSSDVGGSARKRKKKPVVDDDDDSYDDDDGDGATRRPRRDGARVSKRSRRDDAPQASAPRALDSDDLGMMAARKVRGAMRAMPYDVELVPAASKDLDGSVLLCITDRGAWNRDLSEMLSLTGEAAWRRAEKCRRDGVPLQPAAPHDAKPLMLEYCADRVSVDDPLFGWQLRRRDEGWLQGFIALTTYTTWAPYLRWDSRAQASGITADDVRDRAVDVANDLAAELEAQPRGGDPETEGVIFPTIAEVSLLGGLGCGAALLALALADLEEKGVYNYVVLQATDMAIPFYEAMGFVRVGCVAQHASTPRARTAEEQAAARKSRKRFEAAPLRTDDAAAQLYALRTALRVLLWDLSALDVKDAAIFQEAVDPALVSDYLDVISRPMDFGLMRRKLVADEYSSLASLERDFDQVWRNCTTYNPPGNPWHDAGARLRRHGAKKVSAWRQRYADLAQIDGAALARTVSASDYGRAADADPDVMGLCAWSFSNSPVQDMYPCYMMAKRLKRRPSTVDAAEEKPKRFNAAEGWLPAFPRGVTPRGSGFTAKLTAGGNSDYLGFYESRDAAQEAYAEAARKYEFAAGAPTQLEPQRPIDGAVWLASLVSRRQTLEVAEAPRVLGRRLAHEAEFSVRARANAGVVAAARSAAARVFAATGEAPKMYNAVVVVDDAPPLYAATFWFVLQFVPDCQWCHLCPLVAAGTWASGKREGRTQYRLAPEGSQRELDVSALRCVVVRSDMVQKTDDANDEIFDIRDLVS
ncbi:hypothetical protein M885DRAFT_507551 [Pelagophyceae sp. CCMP2097]|nr:hypothetical protein M885DRAFT_507551 [Pelagophyceae sp. CCMP2097]